MKLLLDMNLSPRLVSLLGLEGIDATHWSEVGAVAASDREILAFAAAKEFILVTHDLDFSAILAAGGASRPSVVLIRADNLATNVVASRLVTVLASFERDLLDGALVTLELDRARARLLPLR